MAIFQTRNTLGYQNLGETWNKSFLAPSWQAWPYQHLDFGLLSQSHETIHFCSSKPASRWYPLTAVLEMYLALGHPEFHGPLGRYTLSYETTCEAG